MNRKISLLLVLSIVLGMFAPMATYAADSNAEAKKLVELLRKEGTTTIELESYIEHNKDSVRDLIESQYDELKAMITDQNKEKIEERYGITGEKLEELKENAVNLLDEEGLKNAIKHIRGGKGAGEPEALAFIQEHLNKNKAILDEYTGSTWKEEILAKGTGYEDLYTTLSKEFRKNVIGVKETCNGSKKSVEIIFEDNLKDNLKVSSEAIHKLLKANAPKYSDEREKKILEFIDKGKAKIEEKLNKDYEAPKSAKLEELVKAYGFKFDGVTCPEDGGTVVPPTEGGGVIPPVTETPAGTYAEDRDKKKVFLDEKHLDISKVKETSRITISDDHVKAAIEQLKKSLGTDTEDMVLNVRVPEGTGVDVDLVLSGKALKAFYKDKVAFKVEGSRGSLLLAYDSLDVNLFGDSELIKLKIDKIDNRIASEDVREEDALKKALDIYIEITKNGKTTKIYTLDKLVEAVLNVEDLGNPDILAIHRNQSDKMEFITGKIRDNKMSFKTDDLGRFVLVETYIGYSDTRNHWSRDAVKSMAAKNVVNGVGNNMFKPDNNITRAEFAKMIVASLEVELVDYKNNFKDVKKSDWFATYIATAHDLGLVEGKTINTFEPNAKITREEMAAILSRLDKEELTKEEIKQELGKYKDGNKVAEWAKPHVAKISKSGVMTGKSIGFDPKANSTRGEGATTMFRIYNIY